MMTDTARARGMQLLQLLIGFSTIEKPVKRELTGDISVLLMAAVTIIHHGPIMLVTKLP